MERSLSHLSHENSHALSSLLERADSTTPSVRDFWRVLLLCFNTPRPSSDYDGINRDERLDLFRAIIKTVCDERALLYREDKAGNIVIANFSDVGKAKVCFQGHMDVVVSKNESVVHSFETDGVDVRLTAEGTIKPIKGITLGADNGVAIACGLAMLCNYKDTRLELLITKNEETSFSGAIGLDASLISADVIMNLDSEEESAICVGSAGGFEQHFHLPCERSQVDPSYAFYSLKIRDLKGGHSGIDIDKEKENAILAMTRILLIDGIRIVSINGGTSSNAIPRECSCVVAAKAAHISQIEVNFSKLKAEILRKEDSVKLEVSPISKSDMNPFTEEGSRRILSLLFSLKSGVVRRIPESGDVECSINLGLVITNQNTVSLKYLVRSTSQSWMQFFSQQLTLIGEQLGAQVDAFKGYFGVWEPDFNSDILKKLKAAHPGGDVMVYTVHAGLECCTILERFKVIGRKNVECASIGPRIENAHSPDECLYIESAVRFVNWVEALVQH